MWRGLRVRTGLHTGLSDIRYDEVTKGYDYYGDTSNMAARTEAVANGGQVVATESTWWAMSDAERADLPYENLGPQGLRGVPHAVEMYQLNPVPGRTHAALRAETPAFELDDTHTDSMCSSDADALLSSAGTMSSAVVLLAQVLTACFAPYPPAQRIRELQPLLAKWNVGAPPRHRNVSEEDYCQGLINRLAVRIGEVPQAWQSAAQRSSMAAGVSPVSTRTSNPLRRSGLNARHSLRAGLPPVHSAMTELREEDVSAFHGGRAAPSDLVVAPLAGARGTARMRVAGASDRTDTVVPFTAFASPPVSSESSVVFGNHSATELVTVRMPHELSRRRRTSKPDLL
ncbi:Adenylate and Guanylate cyclase catalytic domain containing protein [Novymonas esmeraldas]|uniref:Adenylate and Guanylate cyclase catalytic domain containing protein n=1 Tax=Novymonas esmeraldas TaxID=1808958 RepID=A0AAW0F041_9TRYP